MTADEVLLLSDQDPIPADIRAALRRAGFEHRPYQQTAVVGTLVALLTGKNAEINLPPGTGKTIISQIAGLMWNRMLRSTDQKKVLFLLPSTALREQHYEVCIRWTLQTRLCRVLEITDEWQRKKTTNHWAACYSRDVWFTLPGKFVGALRSGHISPKALHEVGLVVIDEYDAFSVAILKAEQGDLRFAADFKAALDVLRRFERRYLFLSATAARPPAMD